MSSRTPTIIDNRDGNTLLKELARLLATSSAMDVATGNFEIGSLMALDKAWHHLEGMRILFGDETTKRTKRELVDALDKISDESIEAEKERNDDLSPLAAIREALVAGKINAKVYTKAKFHAKCYLFNAIATSPVDFAIVGSSNFTRPGLTQNMELNLFSTDSVHIEKLREWYNQVWSEADKVDADLLKVIEPHLKEYDPFVVYARALYEYFAGRERTQDDWEANESVIYPMLSQYQRDGYHRALQIADSWNGALVCDGVGLGKTFIGLMLIERYLKEGKRVLLIVPKSAERSVWIRDIDRYLKPRYRSQLRIWFDLRRHTDFGREGTLTEDDLFAYRKDKDVIIIDEAHHFRNPLSNRGKLLMDLAKDKKIFFLTATPINNSLDDLYHLINYFAQDKQDYFSRIRINNLRRHFIDNEKRLLAAEPNEDIAEAAGDEDFLRTDDLLRNLLIQRSRKYVKDSETGTSRAPLFPERQRPRVINYSLKIVYASIYDEIKAAFDKDNPLLSLAIYNTSAYSSDADQKIANSQRQVVGLIRTLLLKRLESSFKAFEASLEDLLEKMARTLKAIDSERYEKWDSTNRRWWKIVQDHTRERLEREDDEEDNSIPEVVYELEEKKANVTDFVTDLEQDVYLLTEFLSKIYRRFYIDEGENTIEDPTKDDKLQKLIEYLSTDNLLVDQKVLIFTEFKATARYLAKQLKAANIPNVEQIDSARNVDREQIIKRFAPYYNSYSSSRDLKNDTELSELLANPIDVLISTDVLSEGLNLQDCSLLINYDLHWNPVRLMQRIGRVDRRLNSDIEKHLKRADHLDGKIYFWNFLPPKELEDLLHLKKRLDGKILRINKTLGIEGALLSPDDEDSALKLFNEKYEGRETTEELMNLERQRISAEHSELWNVLAGLPRRLFSGKAAGDGFTPITNRRGEIVSDLQASGRKGLFCCYRMPLVLGKAPTTIFEQKDVSGEQTHTSMGEVRWYFFDHETAKVTDDLAEIWTICRCQNNSLRRTCKGATGLADPRKAIEKHIKNTYLKDIQAPAGQNPVLLAWMEIV